VHRALGLWKDYRRDAQRAKGEERRRIISQEARRIVSQEAASYDDHDEGRHQARHGASYDDHALLSYEDEGSRVPGSSQSVEQREALQVAAASRSICLYLPLMTFDCL
jgi:hypothetical protein